MSSAVDEFAEVLRDHYVGLGRGDQFDALNTLIRLNQQVLTNQEKLMDRMNALEAEVAREMADDTAQNELIAMLQAQLAEAQSAAAAAAAGEEAAMEQLEDALSRAAAAADTLAANNAAEEEEPTPDPEPEPEPVDPEPTPEP